MGDGRFSAEVMEAATRATTAFESSGFDATELDNINSYMNDHGLNNHQAALQVTAALQEQGMLPEMSFDLINDNFEHIANLDGQTDGWGESDISRQDLIAFINEQQLAGNHLEAAMAQAFLDTSFSVAATTDDSDYNSATISRSDLDLRNDYLQNLDSRATRVMDALLNTNGSTGMFEILEQQGYRNHLGHAGDDSKLGLGDVQDAKNQLNDLSGPFYEWVIGQGLDPGQIHSDLMWMEQNWDTLDNVFASDNGYWTADSIAAGLGIPNVESAAGYRTYREQNPLPEAAAQAGDLDDGGNNGSGDSSENENADTNNNPAGNITVDAAAANYIYVNAAFRNKIIDADGTFKSQAELQAMIADANLANNGLTEQEETFVRSLSGNANIGNVTWSNYIEGRNLQENDSAPAVIAETSSAFTVVQGTDDGRVPIDLAKTAYEQAFAASPAGHTALATGGNLYSLQLTAAVNVLMRENGYSGAMGFKGNGFSDNSGWVRIAGGQAFDVPPNYLDLVRAEMDRLDPNSQYRT